MSAIEEDYPDKFFGLSLHNTADFLNPTNCGLNAPENRDAIVNKEWPEGTKATYIYPELLRDLFYTVKPTHISQISPVLAEARYAGVILSQVVLTPSIDITEGAREAFVGRLYEPSQLHKRDYAIRAWSMASEVDIGLTQQDTDARHPPPTKFSLNDGVDMYVFGSTVVQPDTMLNRAVTLAKRQGVFTIEAANDTYPLPLNHYEFELTWNGIRIVKQFNACQERVRFHNTFEALQKIDPEAAAIYEQHKTAQSFTDEEE